MNRRARLVVIVVGGVAAGALVGSVGVGVASAGRASSDVMNTNAAMPNYERNSAGLTYGSVRDAPRPDLEPDLILVETSNGQTGYARKADMDGPTFHSPADAIAWQQSEGGKSRTIPVYAQDGVTVIGKFVMGSSHPGEDIVSK